jgi:hypothetical protein
LRTNAKGISKRPYSVQKDQKYSSGAQFCVNFNGLRLVLVKGYNKSG